MINVVILLLMVIREINLSRELFNMGNMFSVYLIHICLCLRSPVFKEGISLLFLGPAKASLQKVWVK